MSGGAVGSEGGGEGECMIPYCMSSLMILQQLMANVNSKNPPKPCEYFDMIGGTSTSE